MSDFFEEVLNGGLNSLSMNQLCKSVNAINISAQKH